MDKSKLTRRMTKQAENDVLIEYLAKDIEGNDVVVDSEEIGIKGVQQKREIEQVQIDFLNITKVKKAELIAGHEAKIAEFDAIEVELNRVL